MKDGWIHLSIDSPFGIVFMGNGPAESMIQAAAQICAAQVEEVIRTYVESEGWSQRTDPLFLVRVQR